MHHDQHSSQGPCSCSAQSTVACNSLSARQCKRPRHAPDVALDARAGMPLYKIAPMFLEQFRAPLSKATGARKPNVVLITAIPADPCQFPIADFINKLSVVNKQDYARLHNFELHISAEIDPNVTAVRLPAHLHIETSRQVATLVVW